MKEKKANINSVLNIPLLIALYFGEFKLEKIMEEKNLNI